jgi:hypothetical protein
MATRLDTLRYYLGRLGMPGMAGMLLLLGSVIFWLSVGQPKAVALSALAADNAQQRQKAAARAALPADGNAAPALPPLAPAADAALRRLYAAAGESRLQLEQGEYRLVEIRDAKLSRYQLSLPLQGSYPALRSFLARALNQEPALALTALQLQREAVEATELEATLNFSLFLEGAP